MEIADTQDARGQLGTSLIFAESRLLFDTVPGENGEPRVPQNEDDLVGKTLRGLADRAKTEMIAESAYLILTAETMRHMKKLKDRGLQLRFLTNSLASNNHTTAFVGYRKQRGQQLDVLTELYEYRPDAKLQVDLYREFAPGQPIPHMGLHAKTVVIDREIVFVGSFNLDPRSENLNTEIGLLVNSPELGQLVATSILADMGSGSSWRIRRNDQGQTEWVTIEQGRETIEPDNEPLSSAARKFEADAAQPLTPESEL